MELLEQGDAIRRAGGPGGIAAAAFFDLDKTILSTSSTVALREPLMRAGLVTRRDAAIGMLIHLPYLLHGADEARMEHMKEGLGELARGWDAQVLESTVREALTQAIDPVCFTEALDMIALHKDAGRSVVIASASVQEMVRPIAELLGADFSIGSLAQTDGTGAFTGRIERYNYGAAKARACLALAEAQGWDPAHCYAYSDSVTDLPLLEAVGHPAAVNPDRELRRAAEERRWEVLSFSHTVRVRSKPARIAVPVAGTAVAVGAAAFALACARRAWRAH
ncbi:MAG: HAD-IB family hydrolase [Actinomyces sp.]|jgi:HAD superfamily hydrolase (TIGR01490 family)|nr:HAD family hydrolase [Actinomyces sp.]MCI1641828.1 HAD-IB family hydrolase [Actinomyces sp.]MCI1662007.1 HAD-IB family hydrolase [Actinomyces sp.]MCI1690793.1 HAD-IB family hydrolase [Actinomyces sp.]MCI1787291.1 HAD-IB family hydrolase [Actinomyces sp.]MCI1829685.1 HAD-IB family hydrolase [Actinomyces sp.]